MYKNRVWAERKSIFFFFFANTPELIFYISGSRELLVAQQIQM